MEKKGLNKIKSILMAGVYNVTLQNIKVHYVAQIRIRVLRSLNIQEYNYMLK